MATDGRISRSDSTTRGWLRGFFDKLIKAQPAPEPTGSGKTGDDAALPARIGHYAITGKLGQGGMGVVYAARDERLERTVAVKMMSVRAYDETARQRFWREARTAASVNHPNVCQIYEIGEDDGDLFIAMELLEGEPLDARLKLGALNVTEALPIGLEMLAALSSLHARGIIHRDLKPSNVFLTAHGVKLLDFGLARPEPDSSGGDEQKLTRTGMLAGTPQYMSPERVMGEVVDVGSDLWAVGTILFEMLAGRPAFNGRTVAAIVHAAVYEQPPALSGPPEVAAVDRVIRRALAKRRDDRHPSADAMAKDLRAIRAVGSGGVPAVAQALTRLVVLPFRVLQPDPESDFLAFSLPDAITTSLSGLGSLVVRSNAVAARFAGDTPDLEALAAQADVDRVVMGTLLRSGDQVRVTAQLVEVPAGTMLASQTIQSALGDLFKLQDDLVRRLVEALSLPLTGTSPPTPDMPADARAYGTFLRANELARTFDGLIAARGLYKHCLELDPAFAPAWAHLGRCHRVIGKFIDGAPDSEAQAEQAFRRALELNPRLTVAHKFFAHLEADIGEAKRALVRLLGEAQRHGNDPELFAGLVHACRYCGLYDESLAAHAEARRLDPNVPTSVEDTLIMTGDVDRLLAIDLPLVSSGGDHGTRVVALGLAGRRDEARDALAGMPAISQSPVLQAWISYLSAWLDRRTEDMTFDTDKFGYLKVLEDPEAIFQEGWLLCEAGEYERGLDFLQRAVAKGYFVAPTLANSQHFDALRGNPTFQKLRKEADAGRQDAMKAFHEAGGDRLLGLKTIRT